MREKSATEHPSLSYQCPFCDADPGTPCRTARGRGHELTRPHSRRIALTHPSPDRAQYRVDALCCVCGNNRTVSSDYSRWQHPDHAGGPMGNAKGWRNTEPLKCQACGEITRHALLNRPDIDDWHEKVQRCALGGDTRGWSEEYVQKLRREYRELFPRNPNLKHRYFVDAAAEAWDEGSRTVTALCGEPGTIHTDPRTWSSSKTKREKYSGFAVAEQLGDTEYEDPETGLWWIDMDCVDCCRRSNEIRRKHLQDRMHWFMARFLSRPLSDDDVAEVTECLERVYRQSDAG